MVATDAASNFERELIGSAVIGFVLSRGALGAVAEAKCPDYRLK
jgi:hypothetical protein